MRVFPLNRAICPALPPQPYSPGSTELRGVLNLTLGVGMLGVSLAMKWACKGRISKTAPLHHAKLGMASILQGGKDLAPMLIVASLGCGIALSIWISKGPGANSNPMDSP